MDDLGGLLAGNYGFRPHNKSAPMSASKPSSTTASRSAWSSSDSWLEDRSPPAHDDLLGGSRGRPSAKVPTPADSILEGFGDFGTNSSMPVFDKPLYDDDEVEEERVDVFDGVPGLRSSSSRSAPFDVFESMSKGSNRAASPGYDDLFENLGRGMPPQTRDGEGKRSGERKKPDVSDFDELIPGFGRSSASKGRESPEIIQPHFTFPFAKPTANMVEDPFIVLESTSTSGSSTSGLYNDPLEHISGPMRSGSTKVDTSSVSGVIFDETVSFGGLQNSMPASKNELNKNTREKSPSNDTQNISSAHQFLGKEKLRQSSPDVFDDILPKVHSSKLNSEKSSGRNDFHSPEIYGRNAMDDLSPKLNEDFETENDVWLTVTEIPLSTQPTSAPPPSRPPPPLIKHAYFGANSKSKDNGSFSLSTHSYYSAKETMQKSAVSPIDELEDFATQKYAHDNTDSILTEEEYETNFVAGEPMFKHGMEDMEREAKSKEYMEHERYEKAKIDDRDLENRENQQRLEKEIEQKEREEREKEQKKLQKERVLQLEKERARQAVERATREARERAAAEARLKAERAAVEKAAAEARQRAERAAVQRAAAEARERAAAEARERAAADARERAAAEARERAAAEAREKAARERAAAEARERAEKERAEREKSERAAVERAAAEARLRAERAAVERAAAEARERAAAQARERAAAQAQERAAAAARERQQKPDDDLESFFGMGTRATSAPKTRSTTVESMFNGQTQNKGSSDGPRTSSTASSNIRKASSATNIVDDLSSIFGGPPASGEFQEIEGETEERRRARIERHQRTLERAAKALAEKNERDMQSQREQAERHRISETLDVEIKRWAAGKEGNLRALLSTLHYVLWPECGWQPVSLTDLITGAAVKKVYRKATLCIHPDKVQQKGATLQQKYIAEKVFDLLKEAWNKFNSEELF